MKCLHSFGHYRESLEKAQELGYHFLRMDEFSDMEKYHKVVFLRHDVDFSLENALKFARLENEMDIRSTYFIRVSAKYNISFFPNYQILHQILELDHEIGLHYTLDIPKLRNIDPARYLLRERRLLEETIDAPIKGICLHDPNSKSKIDLDLSKYDLQYDAFSETFMDKLKYISDSRGSWREGCLCKNIGKYPKLYILTHPIWWFEKAGVENY